MAVLAADMSKNADVVVGLCLWLIVIEAVAVWWLHLLTAYNRYESSEGCY